MSQSFHDALIIGAGISGLACATRLEREHIDFCLISKDIGGRILQSKDGLVNYGAFFVCKDYDKVLPFVTVKKRIRLRDFCFHDKNSTYALHEPRLIPFIPQFIKIERHLLRFKKHVYKLRKNSQFISQKKAIENDPYLHELYMKNAYDFVSEHNLGKGTNRYLSKALYSTTFSTIREMNAFSYLQFLLPLITPIYTFNFEKERMIKPFHDKIIIDTVKDIHHKNKLYTIKTEKDVFHSKHIVLATEITWSSQYANIRNFNKPVITNMVHINGNPQKEIKKKSYHLFSSSCNTQAIANLNNGSYLLYYKDEPPSLHDYFSNHEIIYEKQWNPAGTINGHYLIECNRGNNMYLIGDYNIAGLEESFMTGIYGANQIIKNQ